MFPWPHSLVSLVWAFQWWTPLVFSFSLGQSYGILQHCPFKWPFPSHIEWPWLCGITRKKWDAHHWHNQRTLPSYSDIQEVHWVTQWWGFWVGGVTSCIPRAQRPLCLNVWSLSVPRLWPYLWPGVMESRFCPSPPSSSPSESPAALDGAFLGARSLLTQRLKTGSDTCSFCLSSFS